MSKTHSIITLIILLHTLIAIAVYARDIADKNVKNPDDVKHTNSFFKYDRGYMIPGVGRGIKPKFKHGFNPFTYNPITGGNDGGILGGHQIPRYGGGGGSGGSYVPGSDDTFVPNPGFEVPSPNPGSGITTPTPRG